MLGGVSLGGKSLKDEKWRDACTWMWVGSVETLGPAGGENLTGTGKVGKWESGQMIWNNPERGGGHDGTRGQDWGGMGKKMGGRKKKKVCQI
jgi:hypothetical protein